jgi:hypothetical protein
MSRRRILAASLVASGVALLVSGQEGAARVLLLLGLVYALALLWRDRRGY